MTGSQAGFDRLAQAILDDYMQQFPQEAVAAGLHQYDGRITELEPGCLDEWTSRLRRQAGALADVDPSTLDVESALDLSVLKGAVSFELFRMQERRLFRRSPMDVVHALDPTMYVKRDYAPLEDRAAGLARHLGQIPRILSEARALLELPAPAPDVDTAVGLLDGIAELVRTGLNGALEPLAERSRSLADEVTQARSAAGEAIVDFADWLRSLGQDGATTDDFALGEAGMAKMLVTGEAVDVPLDTIQRLGMADLTRNQRALAVVAQAADPSSSAAEFLRASDSDAPPPDQLVARTESVVAELAEWLDQQSVLDIPAGGRLLIEESPPHLRWAFAWMSAPGAFEESDDSYFYVTPPEAAWDDARQNEWMTKFSSGRLRVVAIHEAYPGHYVHHLHVRRVNSGVRRFFGTYAAWEAWAHYSEQLAIEAGYRPDDLTLRAAQLGEAILRDVRLLAALGMHAGGMTVAQAQALFEEQAYLAPAAARAEAMRGTFDPGYLNYTLGKLMLLKLRDDVRAAAKATGETFHLREFHNRYLSYGPVPVPLVRGAILGPDASEVL